MSSVSQVYYGKRCVMSTSGDSEKFAWESLARSHGLNMLPPTDIEVTNETDQSTFTRFLYDEFGEPFMDIINNMVLTDDPKVIRYIFKETGAEIDVTDKQKEYLMAHYKDEIIAKRKSLMGITDEPEEEPAKAEEVNPESISVEETEAKEKAKKDEKADTSTNSTGPDPSRMHIPDDGFMGGAPNPNKPLNVTVDKTKAPVNPLEVAGVFRAIQPNQYFMPDISNEIYANFPYLKDMEAKITAGGGFKVGYEWASGLLKVKVSAADKPDEVLDKYSLTLDLNGYIVTAGAKWWPGINHKTPVDFQKAYRYDLAAIEKYLAGEEIPKEFICYDDNVAELNKSIDLRTVFNVQGMTDEDAKYVFSKMKDNLKKLQSRINKEYPNARFRLSKYTNKDNFELEAACDVYVSVGGAVANTTGTAAKIQVAGNKAPKLFK